jgi:sugar phosphate isomerase/epimerase
MQNKLNVMKTTRRSFLKKAGTAFAAATFVSQTPLAFAGFSEASKKRSIGFQIWTVREKLLSDFSGTLQEMAKMGYKEVEMCSPLGYGFENLHKMKTPDMKKIIDDAGLICSSSHFNMGELRDSLDNRIEWAHGLGMKQMIASSFWLPKEASLDDYRKAADELNTIGLKTKAAGIQIGFHNHHGEFEKRGEDLIYDTLLDTFDPELVKMQFQVAVFNIGYNAADLFRKHPGRFISAHLADWSAEKQEQVAIGQGDIDWKDFFKAAKTGGVKNFYVEMDPATFKDSVEFLS